MLVMTMDEINSNVKGGEIVGKKRDTSLNNKVELGDYDINKSF